MEINLRKAAALCSSIQDTIDSIDYIGRVSLSEFDDVDNVISDTITQFKKNEERHTELLTALYDIRGKIGEANAARGISNILTELACIDRRITMINSFISNNYKMESLDTVKCKLAKMKTATADSMYNMGGVSVGILDKESLEHYAADLRDLKRQKQKLNDAILELNIQTSIVLTDRVHSVLQTEGLI